MSRHRRQASQALPTVFDVSEEPVTSTMGFASGVGYNVAGGVSKSEVANGGGGNGVGNGGAKKLVGDQPPLPPKTTAKRMTVDGASA
ncbi:hypothetical protein ACHQM5_019181 [Ranunculus cassubicifolius]